MEQDDERRDGHAEVPDPVAEMVEPFIRDLIAEREGLISDEALNAEIEALTDRALESVVRSFSEEMRSATAGVIKQRRRERRAVERAIRRDWGPALDRLETVWQAFFEFGAKHQRDSLHAPHDPASPKRHALIQLHARACRVTREIISLLEAGYADGAHARWRTLHEIAVVASILAESDDALARRYLDHAVVQEYQSLLEYQKHQPTLQYDAVPEAQLEALRRRIDELSEQYGPEFRRRDYGWLAAHVGETQATFKHAERLAGLAHYKGFYMWASEGVHAVPSGLRPLGLSEYGFSGLLVGATNVGLSDPGQAAAISLGHITAAIVNQRMTLETLMWSKSIVTLIDECNHLFAEADQAIRDREQRIAKPRPMTKTRKGAPE